MRLMKLALVLAAGVAMAQTWQSGPTTSFALQRFDGEYFPGTNRVYFLGGRYSTTVYDSMVYYFDCATRTYGSTGVKMPIGVANHEVVLLRDNYNLSVGDTYGLYAVGGKTALLNTKAVQVYYPRSNTVRVVQTDSWPGVELGQVELPGGAIGVNNKMYIVGGWQQYAAPYVYRATWVYDPLAPSGTRWTQITSANLNFGRGYIALAKADSFIYACGGDTFYSSALYARPYTERLDTRNLAGGWSIMANMPRPTGETRAFGFDSASTPYGYQRKVITAGRGAWPNESTHCFIYNTVANSWDTFPSLIGARRNHAAALVPSGTGSNGLPGMWVFGGRYQSDATPLQTSEYFPLYLRDVGVTRILGPASPVESTQSATPACSVYNYGTGTWTYQVRMRIGGFYDQTATVSSHAPGTAAYVTFPAFSNWPRGTHAVTCSTELNLDVATANDRRTGNLTVDVRDVGATKVVVPGATADSGVTLTPACSLYNYGTTVESYQARLKIGFAGYNQTASVTGHAPGTGYLLLFPDWTPAALGPYTVVCSTELATDTRRANDKTVGSTTVRAYNAGVTGIVSPAAAENLGATITPVVTVRNYGSVSAAFDVRLLIDDGTDAVVYDTFRNLTVAARTTVNCTLPRQWTAAPRGVYQVTAFTCLGDPFPQDDTVYSTCRVSPPWPDRWDEAEPMPATPSSKAIKDGAWLTYGPDRELFFGLKGNKTGDFYSYNPNGDSNGVWTQLTSLPNGNEAKPPSKGSAGCYGDGYVFATKGSNTQGFWRYSVDSLTWTQLPVVPLGPSNKRVKGGTDMVYVVESDTGFVYLLKGYKADFFRFNTATGAWDTTLPQAPAGGNPKWDKGSWVAFNPQPEPPYARTIFAHKAKYHELWAFDVPTHVWGASVLPGMPMAGSTGKTKKSKDGGSGTYDDGGLYALKGGNTQEFWKFAIATLGWTELDTMPCFGSTGKKKRVKSGGDIAAMGGGVFFAFKGNKTLELWRYKMPAAYLAPRPDRGGVAAGAAAGASALVALTPSVVADGRLNLTVSGRGAFTLTVYDVSGRAVLVRSVQAGRNTTVVVPQLAPGVYLVKVEGTSFTATRKLVVE